MPGFDDGTPNDDLDADFDSGFTQGLDAPTTTPVDAASNAEAADAPAAPSATTTPPPEYARITTAEYQDLLRRAGEIDSQKVELKQVKDTAFGKIGGLEQLVKGLQANTAAGQQVVVSESDFEELIAAGYSDLASMQAAGLNRALAKAKVAGTAPAAAVNPDQIGQIFDQRLGAEREALRQSLREEIRFEAAEERLTEQHPDYHQVLASPEFKAWQAANKVDERKDRKGIPFQETVDAAFVGKVISDFKASIKQASAQQKKLASAVQPRGSGGHSAGPSEEDEFDAGFNS